MNKFSISALAAAFAAVSVGSYLSFVEYRSAVIPKGEITSTIQISKNFQESRSLGLVNPNGHTTMHDTRSIDISIPPTLPDEAILARFVHGFFGGYAFGPERCLLILLGRNITYFKQIADTPISSEVWSTTQLLPRKLPEPHTQLFGAFRVVDIGTSQTPSVKEQNQTYIDFAYGSDNGLIAGVHRFSVFRRKTKTNSDSEAANDEKITIEFASASCNPRRNKRLGPDVLQKFHMWYAMLLFQESVAVVMKDI